MWREEVFKPLVGAGGVLLVIDGSTHTVTLRWFSVFELVYAATRSRDHAVGSFQSFS